MYDFKVIESANYKFHVLENSLADSEIEDIIKTQENAFSQITTTLKIKPSFKINYYLLESPKIVGEIYGDDEPCNGFALKPDTIYAVYNQDVKCIGPHEDAHIISYLLGIAEYSFVREGIAMYFDKTWWGRNNEEWVFDYIDEDKYIKVESLIENKDFDTLDCVITYPIAGAFTKYLIDILGIDQYLELYKSDSIKIKNLKLILNTDDLDDDFIQWIKDKHENY